MDLEAILVFLKSASDTERFLYVNKQRSAYK